MEKMLGVARLKEQGRAEGRETREGWNSGKEGKQSRVFLHENPLSSPDTEPRLDLGIERVVLETPGPQKQGRRAAELRPRGQRAPRPSRLQQLPPPRASFAGGDSSSARGMQAPCAGVSKTTDCPGQTTQNADSACACLPGAGASSACGTRPLAGAGTLRPRHARTRLAATETSTAGTPRRRRTGRRSFACAPLPPPPPSPPPPPFRQQQRHSRPRLLLFLLLLS